MLAAAVEAVLSPVYPDAGSKNRDIDNLEVRLDEIVKSAEDVRALGIENGDFVFIDPKFTITDSGFLKSRFIDDKASAVYPGIDEFVTVDMGCVGMDLAGNEYAVSICAKDSGGPYDYELTSRLITLAKEHTIDYTVDIFPFYGSDIGAAWRAGVDCKGALIGTGVCASHGMERTHMKGIEATLKLLYLYLCRED